MTIRSAWLVAVLGASVPAQNLTLADKQGDLDELLQFVRSRHPDPYWLHDEAVWKQAEAGLRQRLPALTDSAFLWQLARLIGLLRDGHSVLVPFPPGSPARTTLPLEIRWFADGPFVLAAPAEAAVLLGGEVLAVGGMAIGELQGRLAEGIGHDNDGDLRQRLPRFVVMPWLLQVLAVHERESGIEIRVRNGEHEVTATVPVAPAGRLTELRRIVPAANDLLRERHADRKFFAEVLPDLDAYYVRLRVVEDANGQRLAAFLNALPRQAQAQMASRLVLDVRGNPGGSNDHVRAFVRLLRGSDFDAPGALFVLTDGGTFSAAQNLCTWLERDTQALFVGEPSGGRPNHFGDAQRRTLTATGALLAVSTRRWQDSAAEDQRAFLAPDLPAPLRYADWVAGLDPALAAIESAKAGGGRDEGPRWRRASQADVPKVK